jgi:hypothetical protein
MPQIPMALPVVAAFSIAGIARLVAPWPWLPIVFMVGWAVVAWTVRLETEPDVLTAPELPAIPPEDPADDDKVQVRAMGSESTRVVQVGLGTSAVDVKPPSIRMRPRRRAEFDLAQIVAEPVVVTTPEMPPHPRPLAVRAAGLSLAFLGFVAAGGFVPGGLAINRAALSQTNLIQFVALNALVAGVVGYRLAGLAFPHRMDRIVRIVAIGQYGVPVAIGAAVLRTLALPLLFIPALLGVITYLLTDLRESPEPVSQNQRLLEELAVIGVVALVVIGWGVLGR